MAGASSISGLSTGLDTASIISQLMQLEAVPQTRLKTQQTSETAIQSALRALNTTAASLNTKAASLAKPTTWQAFKGAVTGEGMSVTVGSAATASSYSVTVDRLARTHQIAFTDAAALDDVVAGSTVDLTTHDGTVHHLNVGGGTLKELAASINASSADTGVRATTVKVADGSYKLLTESTTTGAATSFTLTDGDGTDLLGGGAVRAGQDAQVTLGLGITASSTTNTFTDLTPGLTLTLDPAAVVGSTHAVTVTQDPTTVTTAVKDLVDQVNSFLSKIDTQTANQSGSTAAGVLAGDVTARSLRSQLLETVFGGSGSMATVGIQTDRDGMLVLDADAFSKAYAADPAGVAAKFTTGATTSQDGWAARVATVTKAASDSRTGFLTTAINGHGSTIADLGKSIDAWDDRLALRKSTLERQYTALETALNKLSSQSSWLSGQIASLPTNS